MRSDYLQWILVVNITACAVLGLTAIIIAANNLGSRNIALGTGALIGAIVAFGLQLAFDLRRSAQTDQVSFSYTFDFREKLIRQWDYTKVTSGDFFSPETAHASTRLGFEIEAGKWLFANRRELIDKEIDRVTSDLAMVSLVAFLGSAGRDWQWEVKRFNSSTLSHASIRPLSKKDDCTYVDEGEIRTQLRAAANVFADLPNRMLFSKICLPPGTKLQITSSTLALVNPTCQIRFEAADSGTIGGTHVQPTLGLSEFPKLPDGTYRYDTRDRSFDIETDFFALRSQSLERPKYDEWLRRLVASVHQWFACC